MLSKSQLSILPLEGPTDIGELSQFGCQVEENGV